MSERSAASGCPRCGRAQPPDASSRFCVHCGRSLSGVQWVAEVPAGSRPPAAAPRRRYAGPPAYREIPRWSLWPWASAEPAEDPVERRSPTEDLRALEGLAVRLAAVTAVLAMVAALAEGWRYVLLLLSRSGALSPTPLAFSDTLVALAGLLTPISALATGVVFLRWLVRGREIASAISGTEPARSTLTVVLGSVLPGPNLTVPGAALAEMEHVASGLPTDRRPRPSLPVGRWWAAWAASVVLGWLAVLRGWSGSTQALADAVLLHGLVDVATVVAALMTIRVVEHLTALLAPELRAAGRDHVLAIRPAEPEPDTPPVRERLRALVSAPR